MSRRSKRALFQRIKNRRALRAAFSRLANRTRGGRIMARRFAVHRQQRGFVRTGGNFRLTSVPGNIGRENKFFDSNITSSSVAIGGSVLSPSLMIIDQGTSVSTMLGKKIIVTKVMVQGFIELPDQISTTQGNVVESDTIKLFVYLDKQCNGTAATVANVFESGDINTFREIDTTTQFTMIKTLTRTIKTTVTAFDDGGVNTWSSNFTTVPFSVMISCRLPIEYSGTTGRDITNIRSNNVGIIAFSNQGVIDITYRWRLRFEDA